MRKIIAIALVGLSLAGCQTMNDLDAKYGYHGSMAHPCLGRGLDCNPELERARLARNERGTAVYASDIFQPDYATDGPVGIKPR